MFRISVFLCIWFILSYVNSTGPSLEISIIFLYAHLLFNGSIFSKAIVAVFTFISIFMTKLCSFIIFNYIIGKNVLINTESIYFLLSLLLSNFLSFCFVYCYLYLFNKFKKIISKIYLDYSHITNHHFFFGFNVNNFTLSNL